MLEIATTTIALFGAGGNMGTRLTNALKNRPEFSLFYVETGEKGIARLEDAGLSVTPADEALVDADVVILAVPDALIGAVAPKVIPFVKTGAIVMTLDPAAPYAGKLPERDDITYFVTHPAHPPVYNDETDMAARRDFFGSGLAKQAIVCALMQGPESDYARGEEVATAMWGPVLRSHRVTVEQMAMLEPALSETVACTCAVIMREAMDEAISRGVPAQAARDFLMGHINIALAVAFDEIDWDFSAGAKMAIEDAKRDIFQPDWKKVFDEENIRASIRNITG
jgi:D-apionate oxidoisomerase